MKLKAATAALAVALLALAATAPTAGAAKKKNTGIAVNLGPVLNGKQNVKVSGHLNTSNKCKSYRAMKLFLTDVSGNVVGTLDGTTSDVNGNWKLSAKLPAAPTTSDRLKVKAGKRSVDKLVCKAGFSQLISITS